MNATRNDFIFLLLALASLATVLTAWFSMSADCEAKGGVFVQWHCVQGVK